MRVLCARLSIYLKCDWASEHSPDWKSIKRECTKPSTEEHSCSLHYLNALVVRPQLLGRWCTRIPCTWRFLVWLSLHRSIPPRLHRSRFHSPKCVPLPLPLIAMPPIAFKVQTGFFVEAKCFPTCMYKHTLYSHRTRTHTHTAGILRSSIRRARSFNIGIYGFGRSRTANVRLS